MNWPECADYTDYADYAEYAENAEYVEYVEYVEYAEYAEYADYAKKAEYESFATVGEIRVYWRADFQSGSRVLKKVFWTFSYLYLWHTMWFHAKKLLKTLNR